MWGSYTTSIIQIPGSIPALVLILWGLTLDVFMCEYLLDLCTHNITSQIVS